MASRRYYPVTFKYIRSVLHHRNGRTLKCLLRQGRLNNERIALIAREAIEHLSETDYNTLILPNIDNSHLLSVFPLLQRKHRWQSVGLAFKRQLCLEERTPVLEEAQKCEDLHETIVCHLLPHYEVAERDGFMRKLVDQNKWKQAGALAALGISNDIFMMGVNRAVCCQAFAELNEYLVPQCGKDPQRVCSLLTYLTKQSMWQAISLLLKDNDNEEYCRMAANEACAKASEANLIDWILPYCSTITDNILNKMIEKRFWKAVCLCLKKKCVTEHQLPIIADKIVDKQHASDQQFLDVVYNCPDELLTEIFFQIAKRYCLIRPQKQLVRRLGWDSHLSQLLSTIVEKHAIDCVEFLSQKSEACVDVCDEVISFINSSAAIYSRTNDYNPNSVLVKKLTEWCQKLMKGKVNKHLEPLTIQSFIIKYHRSRLSAHSDRLLLTILSSVPIFPEAQNLSIMVMVRESKWNIVRHASMSELWEENRREIFRKALNESQWQIVEAMADHTLYDDQRLLALKKAVQAKRWHTVIKLVQYGLTKDEMMHFYKKAAKHANGVEALKPLCSGADAVEITELCATVVRYTQNISQSHIFKERYNRFVALSESLHNDARSFGELIKEQAWQLIFFRLQNKHSHKRNMKAAKMAIQTGAWDMLSQLIMLDLGTKTKTKLFLKMVKLQQWGICRLLLESKVSITKLPLRRLLSELQQAKQWLLIALLMKYPVNDLQRKKIAQKALVAKEGSLFCVCLQSMDSGSLSVKGREKLLTYVMEKEFWQGTKALTEWKDSLGISHRCKVFLKAINCCQWEVVDHCLWNGADMNMRLPDGRNLLQKYAEEGNWEAVQNLVLRDADQFRVDVGDNTILHMATKAKKWSIVKALIESHGPIDQPEMGGYMCPLHELIKERQVHIINTALLWHNDVITSVTIEGETVLHAVCASSKPDVMYYLISRGCKPLALTNNGKSVLMYAVEHSKHPQKTLAVCIGLGLSPHQPEISDQQYVAKTLLSRMKGKRTINSPLEYALVHELPVVAQMLYESGACSNKEIFRLHQGLKRCGNNVPHMEKTWPFLERVAKSPRRLDSLCRVSVSKGFLGCKKSQVEATLRGLSSDLREFVLFEDLRDKKYGWK